MNVSAYISSTWVTATLITRETLRHWSKVDPGSKTVAIVRTPDGATHRLPGQLRGGRRAA